MKVLKNKLVLWLPVIIMIVLVIFGSVMIPSIDPAPKNLPIALVNEDEGMELPAGQGVVRLGEELIRQVKKGSGETTTEDSAVKWIDIATYEQAMEGLNDQNYYAALVIQKDFSQKQATLQTTSPNPPEMTVLINQGSYPSAVNAATQMLNRIVDNANEAIRSQLLEGFEKQGASLSPQQDEALAVPITKTVTYVNE